MVQADLRSLQTGAGALLSHTLRPLMSTVGVIGLGYVGLPLAVAFAQQGCDVIALDADDAQGGRRSPPDDSYIEDVSDELLRTVAPTHPRDHTLCASSPRRRRC